MQFLQTVSTVVGYLVVIGGAVAGFAKFCFWVYDQFQKRQQTSTQGYVVPAKTLSIALAEQREYWWHMGSMGQDPTMQIVGQFTVTNIYVRSVRVVQVEVRYGLFGRKRVVGDVSVSEHLESNYYGSFLIPPNDTRNVSFHVWLYPSVKKPKQSFVAHSVVLTDQFGNRFRIKSVKFEYQ